MLSNRTSALPGPNRNATRWLATVVALGFVLRLVWVIKATHSPLGRYSDPAQYQSIAREFARGRTLSIGTRPSAFWPPGLPMALTPLAWLSAKTGWFSLPFAASLLNTVAGTATVALTWVLARQWIGPSAQLPAAFLMAIAPGPIMWTSTALTETLFTALVLAVVALGTLGIRKQWKAHRFVMVGLIVGFAVLVRSPGIVFLAVPALVIAASRRDLAWRSAVVTTVAMFAGAALVLLPWLLRNGLEVGVWTPFSTNNAAFLCIGNHPDADGRSHFDAEEGALCFRNSPFDDESLYAEGEAPPGAEFETPDEPRWYRRTVASSMRWMLSNPWSALRTVPVKLSDTFKGSRQAISDAEDFGRRPFLGVRLRRLLGRSADLWVWAVLVGALVGILRVRRCRRAMPIWALAVSQTLLIAAGVGLQRFQQSIVPFMAVLAAGLIGEVSERRKTVRVGL